LLRVEDPVTEVIGNVPVDEEQRFVAAEDWQL